MPSPDTNTTVKVLLVEDDEDDAIITQALLEQIAIPRFELDWAPSYDAGMTRIKEHHHDIGLIDYNLGSRTGIDFLREANSQSSHAPIIMLTGQGNESLVLEALESGAIDYLPKRTISSETLQRAICHGIEKIRLQAELASRQRQLEMTNQELQKRTNEIQRFYHLLAHELKTPLTAASEFVNILLEGIPGTLNAEQEEYLHLVQGCCGHLDRNINDLYDITRLETGKFPLQIQADDLHPLIADVLNYLNSKAIAKNITLQVCLPPHLPLVLMDTQRMRQVMLNLVGNALKFTETGGRIRVTAMEDPACAGRVRIAVEDTGIGIPQPQLKGIFERLYQSQPDPSASNPGLGLGLFICREIMKLHEGTVSVTSTVGKGSVFCVTLPCAKDSQVQALS